MLIATAVICALSSSAQTKDTFDNNSWQWIEYSGYEGEAIIKEGVMHLESKKSAKGVGVEITSNGIGFFAYGKAEVDFDNVTIR